jgi:NAD(P)-dependent dehydrogenase (short-subunit alcohol dehydrogenase family)
VHVVSWSVGAGLEGAGVVVTGAAGGIGAEIVRGFDGAGARVLGVDLDEARADAVIAGLDDPTRHRAAGVDLRDLSQHTAVLDRARDEFGRLDVLVHAAAVAIRRPDVDSVSEADWDLQHDINLKGAFFLCRAAGKLMKEQGGGGRIITFTSQAFWTGGFGGSVAYAASKGGIVSMTRGLARTYGPSGITVNTISPGLIDTPMLMDDLPEAQLEALRAATPLGRIAAPGEIAGTAVFLASTHASYISGATINVSGGFLMY